MLEDDSKFQGLLDIEEEVVYLDINAKLPGVELEEKELEYQMVTDELELEFLGSCGSCA